MSNADTSLARQWRFLRMLGRHRQGVTLQELAEAAGVTERTVRRDLEKFRQLGFPLQERIAEFGKKLWCMPDERLASLTFTLDEALAFYLGRRHLDPLAGTALGDAAQQAFAKIRSCFPSSALRYLDRLADGIQLRMPGASDYTGQAQVLDELFHAIADRCQTVMTYQSQSATEPVEYEVHPYGLVKLRGSLYLIAYSRDHGEIRTFKVNRIEQAEATRFPFERPADFDLERFLQGAFGIMRGDGAVTVELRFDAEVARFVEEGRWHESQRLERQRDGGLRARFELTTFEEILRWILSFGRHCEVLGPPELRERHAEEAAAIAERYAPSGLKRTDSPRR